MADLHGFSYFETSAKTGESVCAVFEAMGNKVLGLIEKGDIDPT